MASKQYDESTTDIDMIASSAWQATDMDERMSCAWQKTGEYIYKGIRAYERENNLKIHDVKFVGMLPSPSTLDYYEKNWPGAIDRILILSREYMDRDHKNQTDLIEYRNNLLKSMLQSPLDKINAAITKCFK